MSAAHLQRIGEAQPQPLAARGLRRKRAHIGDVRENQRVLLLLQAGLEDAGDGELAQSRLGRAVGGDHRNQQRQRVAEAQVPS